MLPYAHFDDAQLIGGYHELGKIETLRRKASKDSSSKGLGSFLVVLASAVIATQSTKSCAVIAGSVGSIAERNGFHPSGA